MVSKFRNWMIAGGIGSVLALGISAGVLGVERPPAASRNNKPARGVHPANAVRSLDAPVDARASHPLDPALQIAYDCLDHIHDNVRDYTAVLAKRERNNGQLGEHQFIQLKIRSRQTEQNQVVTPFSIYLKFLRPRSVEGREVIWVEGRDGGKLVAHEGGFKNLLRVKLDPNGTLAMMGQKYPIYDVGLESLVRKLIEKGERDKKRGECEVKFYRDAKVDNRVCTLIEVKHPHPRPYFDFHIAQIFFDEEERVPIRYAAYLWPAKAGEEPILEEEFTYQNLKLNVGLEDADFDPDNREYRFP